MNRRPPSGPSRFAAEDPTKRRVDVRGWLGNIRFSGFSLIMLGLVVLGAFVLVPSVSTLMQQRQAIALQQQQVQAGEAEVAELEALSKRWRDPAYITSQARERLYYEKPGQVVYIVNNDLPDERMPQEPEPISDEVVKTRTDWMSQFVTAVTVAGLAEIAAAPDTAPSNPTSDSDTATPEPEESSQP